jgi:hypothetical protein
LKTFDALLPDASFFRARQQHPARIWLGDDPIGCRVSGDLLPLRPS